MSTKIRYGSVMELEDGFEVGVDVLGEVLGEGCSKRAHACVPAPNKALVVWSRELWGNEADDDHFFKAIDEERAAAHRLEALGVPVAKIHASGVVKANDGLHLALLMDLHASGSRDTRPGAFPAAVTEATIPSAYRLWQRCEEVEIGTFDTQFLIDRSGCVVFNDTGGLNRSRSGVATAASYLRGLVRAAHYVLGCRAHGIDTSGWDYYQTRHIAHNAFRSNRHFEKELLAAHPQLPELGRLLSSWE